MKSSRSNLPLGTQDHQCYSRRHTTLTQATQNIPGILATQSMFGMRGMDLDSHNGIPLVSPCAPSSHRQWRPCRSSISYTLSLTGRPIRRLRMPLSRRSLRSRTAASNRTSDNALQSATIRAASVTQSLISFRSARALRHSLASLRGGSRMKCKAARSSLTSSQVGGAPQITSGNKVEAQLIEEVDQERRRQRISRISFIRTRIRGPTGGRS